MLRFGSFLVAFGRELRFGAFRWELRFECVGAFWRLSSGSLVFRLFEWELSGLVLELFGGSFDFGSFGELRCGGFVVWFRDLSIGRCVVGVF